MKKLHESKEYYENLLPDECWLDYWYDLGREPSCKKSIILFCIILLMSAICSAQTTIQTMDVNGVTKLHARLNAPATVIDPPPVYPPNTVYIGIPAPSFGINETYRMYDYEPNQNPALTYYDSPSGGKYTHYVDSTSPNATTNGVPSGYGSPDHPRTYVPLNLPAGSIVEVHNNSLKNSEFLSVTGEGTEQYPIFVRGVNDPNITQRMGVGYYGNSSYIIVEGMKFNRGSVSGRQTSTSFVTNHICVRNSEFASYSISSGGFAITGNTAYNSTNNVVLYNCSIHDNGPYTDYEHDVDCGGVPIGGYTSYVWVLDCTMYNNSYNGVQVGGNVYGEIAPHHIYIGGNTAYQNRQTGFWAKDAYDVIFSQNVSYNPRQGASGGLGFQYDPQRVWFLFNTVYSADRGFRSGSGLIGEKNPDYDTYRRKEIYIIGNLVYNCNIAGMEFDGHTPPTNSPVMFNTIYNCPIGIYNGYYPAYINAYNNIIANCTTSVNLLNEYDSDIKSDFDYNLLYDFDNIKWNSTYTTLAGFISGAIKGEGANCLEADPLFVNADANDFNLQSTSPVIGMTISPDAQAVFDRFEELYGITDLNYYCNQLFIQGVQNAPNAD